MRRAGAAGLAGGRPSPLENGLATHSSILAWVPVNGVCVVQVREFWALLVLRWDFKIRRAEGWDPLQTLLCYLALGRECQLRFPQEPQESPVYRRGVEKEGVMGIRHIWC